MSRLELKVAPDVVWVLVAGLMWLASVVTPHLDLPSQFRVGTAVVLAVVGVGAIVSGRVSLARAKHDLAPDDPRTAPSSTKPVPG